MPDGDDVRCEFAQPFRRPFDTLCQGVMPQEEIVRRILEALKQSITLWGDEPIRVLRGNAGPLERIHSAPLVADDNDWRAVDHARERLTQEVHHPVAAKIVATTYDHVRTRIEYSELPIGANVRQELMMKYVESIYDSQFHVRIPHALKNHSGVDPVKISSDAVEIRSKVLKEAEAFAAQLVRREQVKGLQMPSRPRGSSGGGVSASFSLLPDGE